MCRLFGMTTGGARVRADFWLLDAPQSLAQQSRRQPDGTGLGWFGLGNEPVRDRAPVAAFQDQDFTHEAASVVSHTFLAHIRYASTGAVSVHNTHPFDINDRLFAHNGVVKGLEILDSWLTDIDKVYVEGQTDSELVFAYIAAEIRRLGDTTKGIISAVERIGQELPIYALNFLLAEPGKLWALRYPDTHPLWVLSPEGGGSSNPRQLASHQEPSHIHIDLQEGVPAVLIASERLDDDPDWRLMRPGELLVVDGLRARSLFPFTPPAHLLSHADLNAAESTSQDPTH